MRPLACISVSESAKASRPQRSPRSAPGLMRNDVRATGWSGLHELHLRAGEFDHVAVLQLHGFAR